MLIVEVEGRVQVNGGRMSWKSVVRRLCVIGWVASSRTCLSVRTLVLIVNSGVEHCVITDGDFLLRTLGNMKKVL
ncbi:MAG: hypothetical protein QXK43_05315 [Candidatus Jordarchaeales archaeon]